MRIRNFLVIHSSRSIRALIKRCILSEFGDVHILEADTGEGAVALMMNQDLDLVICSCDLEDMSVTNLKWEIMAKAPENKPIHFIVLLEEEVDKDKLLEAGLEHILHLPFDPRALVAMINQVSNPRQWRQSDRYHIPKSLVVLNVWGMEAEAKLINISRGGVFIEITDDRADLLLQNNPKLTIKIKSSQGCYHIPYLPAKITRLNAVEWNSNYKPIVMRAAYSFLDLEKGAEDELIQVLKMAKEQNFYADDE